VADYSAKIKLIVDGLQSLKQVEERLTNLNRLAALDLGKAVKGTRTFGAVKKEVDDLAGSFSNLGKIVRGIAVGTGLGALTTSINGLSQAATALKFGGISKFAAALAAATGPAAGLFKELSALAIQFPIVAGTATVAGAALLAFSPQILRASNATLRLAKAAAEAGQPLSRLMASLASSGFRVDMFIDATQAVKIYQSRLRELSETVSVLSARQTALQTTLNKFNSESDTAAKIAGKLVDVTKRLNTEQQAQNDLLREAAGLRPESVERRATNTYNVTQRRKGFEADQAADIEVVNQALDKLNRRNINWADALGISAMDAAAQKAEQLTARFIKNDKVVDSWITALYEGKQALAEINRTMEVERLDSYTRAVLAQQRALDLYTDTATQAKRAAEALNYAGETPALRPAGFTDEDVRIKNLIDDENTVANLIANNRKTQAALQSGLDAKFFAQQIEYTQKELNAELDKIETTVQAQLKADRRVQKDFDARLAARGKAKEGRNAMMQNAMIGGAFPMLFGGGAGAVLGGAAGGFIPGNPMMSIVTSALGTMVDQFVAGVTEMGVAVKDLVGNFDKLKEANLFVSKQQEFYIQKLIESGRAAEAAGVIQARIIDIIGTQGVQDLENLGTANTKLQQTFAELTLVMQEFAAGPLTNVLNLMRETVGQYATSGKAELVINQLNKEGKTKEASQLNVKVQDAFRKNFFDVGAGTKEAEQAIREAQKLLKPEQLLKSLETAEKVRDIRKQTIDLERSSQDLRLSIEDTVYGLRKRATDMERDSMEFRRSVEDQVFSKRQKLEQQLLDNDRKRQQNAIDAFDLQLKAASSNLDPIAQGVVDAAREYLRVRAEGEADLQQKEKQLKLQLQQIDQEVSRYTLQVEQRVTQMVIQREEFSRDVSRSKLQIERQIGDYITKVEEYRLKMARMRFDLALEEGNIAKATEIARKQGLGAPASGKNFANVGGFMNGRQMLHGIPGFAGFDKSHATPENIHYHFAGKNPVETKAIAELVKAQGFQVTEFKGFGQRVGKHAPGSQHYSGNAFDIPGASMEGRGGMADIVAGQKRVHAIINDALAAGVGKTAGQTTSQVTAATPSAPTAPTMPGLPSAPQLVGVNDLLEQYLNLQTQIKAAAVANVQLDKENLAVNSDQARLALEQKLLQPLQQHVEQNRELEFENQQRRVRNRLLAEGMAPEIVEGELRVLEIERDLASVLEGLNVVTNKSVNAALKRANANATLVDSTFQLTEATLTGLLATTEDTKKQEELRAKLQQVLDTKNSLAGLATGTATGAITGAQGAAAGNIQTPAEKIEGRIGTLKKEVADLTNIGNIAITVADGIGEAFSTAFQGLISGSISAREALSGFFKSVGDMFVEMAAQIIAKQMTMIILQTILKALGAVGGGSGGGGGGTVTGDFMNTEALKGFTPAANGATFANGIAKFANGGIVSSPTLFKFADGGTTRTGLMGEAGPEAIMPLKRGADGSLGVQANGLREAMNQDRAGGSGSPVLNMSFQSTSINGVEYVSRDQLEAAMAQTRRDAIRDGAKRGMTMTLDKLQQSPSTRSRVGMR
jgi:hypothetical protein